MPNSKQDLLDAIRADIVHSDICPELRANATNLVMGDGNPDADIVLIGEAPGKNEDLQGLPFVGASGKFLNEMLASINLKRKDIYITNIVKYRPPASEEFGKPEFSHSRGDSTEPPASTTTRAAAGPRKSARTIAKPAAMTSLLAARSGAHG